MLRFLKKHALVIEAVTVMLLWGALYPMVKLAIDACEIRSTPDTMLFAGMRFAVAGAIMLFISLFCERGELAKLQGKSLLLILSSGLFAIVIHYTLVYTGMMVTESSKTAIIKQIGALVYICFSMFFLKDDKPSVKKTVGALIGFLGIIVINLDSTGFSFGYGDALILLSSFATVFSNVINKHVLTKVAPFTAAGISQLSGGLLLLLLGTALGGRLALRNGLWVIAVTVVLSVASYLLWFHVMQKGTLSSLFIIKFLEVIFASVLSALILGENILRWQYFVAFVMITGGILLANHKKKKERI